MLGTGIEVSAEDTNRPYINLFQDSVNAKVLIKAQSCVDHLSKLTVPANLRL